MSENGDRNVPAAPKNSGPGKTFHQWEGDKTSSGDEVDDYLSLEVSFFNFYIIPHFQ